MGTDEINAGNPLLDSWTQESKFDAREVLVGLLGEHPTPRKKRSIAKSLAMAVGRRDAPFAVSYIENVYNGVMEPGPNGALYRALFSVWKAQQGAHPLMSQMKPVTVWALDNEVPENALVLGRVHYCPYCGLPFIGAVYNQVYCCQEHRKAFKRERR